MAQDVNKVNKVSLVKHEKVSFVKGLTKLARIQRCIQQGGRGAEIQDSEVGVPYSKIFSIKSKLHC